MVFTICLKPYAKNRHNEHAGRCLSISREASQKGKQKERVIKAQSPSRFWSRKTTKKLTQHNYASPSPPPPPWVMFLFPVTDNDQSQASFCHCIFSFSLWTKVVKDATLYLSCLSWTSSLLQTGLFRREQTPVVSVTSSSHCKGKCMLL